MNINKNQPSRSNNQSKCKATPIPAAPIVIKLTPNIPALVYIQPTKEYAKLAINPLKKNVDTPKTMIRRNNKMVFILTL